MPADIQYYGAMLNTIDMEILNTCHVFSDVMYSRRGTCNRTAMATAYNLEGLHAPCTCQYEGH
jgi:hypothetical protein